MPSYNVLEQHASPWVRSLPSHRRQKNEIVLLQSAERASDVAGGDQFFKSSLCRFEGAAIRATTTLSVTQPNTAKNEERRMLFIGLIVNGTGRAL